MAKPPFTTWEACGDACARFFGLCLAAYAPQVSPSATVLEIGCAEFDWLKHASFMWPQMTFTGIDWRTTPSIKGAVTRVKGDVMTTDFPLETFDWVVSVSAIEHIGLGHYHSDPKKENGDSLAMRRACAWMKPGALMYFDVPYNAGQSYQVVRTSHRIYDDDTMQSRLIQDLPWTVRWSGTTGRGVEKLLDGPLEQLAGGEQFYYRGVWLQKES